MGSHLTAPASEPDCIGPGNVSCTITASASGAGTVQLVAPPDACTVQLQVNLEEIP